MNGSLKLEHHQNQRITPKPYWVSGQFLRETEWFTENGQYLGQSLISYRRKSKLRFTQYVWMKKKIMLQLKSKK